MTRLLPRLLGTVLATLLVSACATREAFDARQAALIGRSEADLVAALGVPVRTYEAEGRRFLQYEDRRVVSYPGDFYGGFGYGPGLRRSAFYGYGGFHGDGFGGPYATTRACDLTFELRGGRVVGFAARGNDCVAVPGPAGTHAVS